MTRKFAIVSAVEPDLVTTLTQVPWVGEVQYGGDVRGLCSPRSAAVGRAALQPGSAL